MTKLVGISGSLRRGSYNTALLRAALPMAPSGVEFIAATIHGIPLFDADVEASEGIPPEVARLKELVASADGVILFTPEYNNSLPGVFKNAIDWLSRPSSDIKRVFGGRPFAVLGASPGGFGTILSQNAWLSVLRTLGTEPWFGGRMLVSRAATVFDENGNLTDEKVAQQLQEFIRGFAEFAAAHRRA
jgi:chromate reductase, NAD(P)H dehydrogenase (quinone)